MQIQTITLTSFTQPSVEEAKRAPLSVLYFKLETGPLLPFTLVNTFI